MIVLKTTAEINKMRESGKILAEAMARVKEHIAPGITTDDLDKLAFEHITKTGATPSFLNYRGFPKSACISVNEEVVHGIPGSRVLNAGDIVTLDFGVNFNGFHADSAWTFPVGEIDEATQKLLRVTEESLMKGIEKAVVGNQVGDISAAVQKYVEAHGFGIVRDLVGHGIGHNLHEPPDVPNFGKSKSGPKIKEGMTMCIEPMVNAGTWRVKTLADNWTIVTADNAWAAHFEHTIAVTKKGPEILTPLAF